MCTVLGKHPGTLCRQAQQRMQGVQMHALFIGVPFRNGMAAACQGAPSWGLQTLPMFLL